MMHLPKYLHTPPPLRRQNASDDLLLQCVHHINKSARELLAELGAPMEGSLTTQPPQNNFTKLDSLMLALPTSKRVAEYEVLWAVEDLIGSCKTWPRWVAKIFWMKKLNNADALRLVTFCLGNALPPHVLFQWLRVRGVALHWQKLHTHMRLVKDSMGLDGPTQYFYYDLRAQEYCFMNGLPRNFITKGVKGHNVEQGTKASLPSP
jgi:hypothetical protein